MGRKKEEGQNKRGGAREKEMVRERRNVESIEWRRKKTKRGNRGKKGGLKKGGR